MTRAEQLQWNNLYDEQGFHLFPVLEIDSTVGTVQGLYNTEAKSYYPGEEGAPLYLCPADIPQDLEAELKRLAVAAFEAIGGLDVSRVDFRLGADGQPYLMEINTLPGLNPTVSDLCIMARAEGMPYADLINEIVNLAIDRYGLAIPVLESRRAWEWRSIPLLSTPAALRPSVEVRTAYSGGE